VLLDLPIRDGNCDGSVRRTVPNALLDLPIRDGNKVEYISVLAQAQTFRPSYQGWKHRSHVLEKIAFLPFRPSYQGWKLRLPR